MRSFKKEWFLSSKARSVVLFKVFLNVFFTQSSFLVALSSVLYNPASAIIIEQEIMIIDCNRNLD